jgi:chitinase
MKQLRETLGNDYLLTYAGYCMDKQAVNGGYRYIDIKALDSIVDYVNIMTYDFDADGDPHNALTCSTAYWDITRTYNAYIKAGATPSKLVLGIPFYGRVSFSGSPGALSYKTIKTLGNGYTIDNWDSAASVPYVTYGGARYCYYDNPRSIEIKARWALERKFYGLMYWENDSDDANFTLRRATWESVMTY